jgi:hypothetical protein
MFTVGSPFGGGRSRHIEQERHDEEKLFKAGEMKVYLYFAGLVALALSRSSDQQLAFKVVRQFAALRPGDERRSRERGMLTITDDCGLAAKACRPSA